ncbi:MAG: CDP-diacylglycerol--glycerol-3-phosphate 3-phosphatidyltransferase (EC [uncultured Thiotrichaceae bacterium]|uniref:CDP-diacylglycerol--glycerol-3-phosphate 3-phosphatidyltransferase n=1 Tax=uncultured Thiotrichaceae bacterium TaxID=298394 RepID=A0A6S6U7M9_9GAMM|nr:MAG: CDP-diacylglycerol--glycerol-3-phosphate 3-phosphatidyltransferase (EC [uncultured Thiotrichaceae bacterium]
MFQVTIPCNIAVYNEFIMHINIPTSLTLLRIALIPVMVLFFYLDYPFMAAFIFGIAGLTDWADGYLARKWNQESRLGAFLDPVADKLIVAVAMLLIVEREAEFWITLAAIAIIGREIVISALREWMAEVGKRGKVAVAFIGKVKTTAQIIALMFLLYNQPLFGVLPIREMGLIALAIATVLTIVSMVQYLQAAFRPE